HYNYILSWNLSLTPFIYLFTLFIILFIPIKSFNEKKIEIIELDNTYKITTLGNFAIIYGIALFLVMVLFVDYNVALESASDVYKENEQGELVMPVFIYRFYTLHRLLYPFILLLGFYFLSFKRDKWLMTV